MTIKTKLLDFFASILGISCVDWDEDLSSDGYSDPSGISALNEHFWIRKQTVKMHISNTNNVNRISHSTKPA